MINIIYPLALLSFLREWVGKDRIWRYIFVCSLSEVCLNMRSCSLRVKSQLTINLTFIVFLTCVILWKCVVSICRGEWLLVNLKLVIMPNFDIIRDLLISFLTLIGKSRSRLLKHYLIILSICFLLHVVK